MTVVFWLDGSAENTGTEVTYLPYGTLSLRVRVRTQGAVPYKLRLRPQACSAAEAAQKLFRGFEDGVTDPKLANFQVSWGGGHEMGPCANSEDFLGAFEQCAEIKWPHSLVVVFNLTHISTQLPETAAVTIEAYYYKDDHEEDVVVHNSVTVILRAPAELPNDIQRFIQTDAKNWSVPFGNSLPSYVLRWWPDYAPLKYVSVPKVPPLRLKLDDEKHQLDLYWNQTVVASIKDKTSPSILELEADGNLEVVQAEIFNFDDSFYAVRVWFFWLDVNIGHGFFIGRHEVPDVERFDMLVRKSDGQVRMACTDYHWTENWGVVNAGEPLEATIGLTAQVVKKMVVDVVFGSEHSESKPTSYMDKVRLEAQTQAVDHELTLGTLAAGTESHVPFLVNAPVDKELTSGDVRSV